MKIDYEYEPPFFKASETHYAKTWLLCDKADEYCSELAQASAKWAENAEVPPRCV